MEGIGNPRNSGHERRSHRRYPVDLGIWCRALPSGRVVAGKICDISSHGVRFTSSQILAPGAKVELAIDWPVLLDNACPLALRGQGRVLRSDRHSTAIEIERHEFCTRKTEATAVSYGVR